MKDAGGNSVCEQGSQNTSRGVWRTFDATHGLPSAVWCLHQDTQGYLWLGTNAGLSRYDGKTFRTFTPDDGLPDDSIQAICQDHQGRLWLATGWFGSQGSGVSCYDGKHFVNYTTRDGLAHNFVSDIHCDAQGKLWFATSGGLSLFDGHRFETYIPDDTPDQHTVSAICQDQQGRLWLATAELLRSSGYGVLRYDGNRFTRLTMEDGLVSNHVQTVCMDDQGRVWLGALDSICVYDAEECAPYPVDESLLGNGATAIHCDRKGRLWLGATTRGAICVEQTATDSTLSDATLVTYITEEGSLSHALYGIIDDQDGNIWLARGAFGLACLVRGTFQVLSREPVISGILHQDRDQKLWFGNGRDLFCLDKELHHVKSFWALRALLQDSVGRFWIAAGTQLLRYRSADALLADTPDTLEGFAGPGAIGSILESSDGRIWLGGSHGNLYCFDGDDFSCLRTPCGSFIQALCEDSQGQLWLGSYMGGGLCCYDGEHLQAYTSMDGLLDDHVLSIVADDVGRLWIGTLRGLCRFDGEQFLVEADVRGFVFHPTKDCDGHLWFSTNSDGLYRYDGHHFQHLSHADGLPSNQVEALLPQRDGSMLVGTSHGIVRYHGAGTNAPGIEIREVLADRRYEHPNEVELSSTHASLVSISYQGVSLSTQRIRYSYLLEGYDDDWHDTWESQVRYEQLPVGEYTFRVLSINRDLVESEAPAMLKLTVVPDPRDQQIAALESELQRRNRELEAELADARDMQMRLLPEHAPAIQGAEIAGKCVTANTVGGDFFAYLPGAHYQQIGLVVADVSGKAMRGAMSAVLADGILSMAVQALDTPTPASIMSEVNTVLSFRMESDMNVTMVIALLDTRVMTLTLANAAHHAYPLLVRNGEVQELKSHGLPLGMRAGVQYREETFDLQLGDTLVLMTDGIIEAHDSKGRMYGDSGRLEQVLTGFTSGMTAEMMVATLIQDAIDYGGGERDDDITAVVAKLS